VGNWGQLHLPKTRKCVGNSGVLPRSLAFNDAVDALSRGLDRHIVILFDEFDEPFARLDSRVFSRV